MKVFLTLSLFFSAAICGSLIHRQSNESNLRERASLLLRDSKDVSPEQINRWLEKAVPFDGNIIIFRCFYSLVILYDFSFTRDPFNNNNKWYFSVCTNLTYTDPDGGIISSPNYPGFYSDGLSCTYLIDLRSSADSVLLKFFDFKTEANYDFVKV